MSRAGVSVVERIYEAFGRRDLPALFELFDPGIEWIAAENSPAGARSPYHGPKEIQEEVFARIGSDFEDFAIRVDELLDAGDRVVMLGYYLGARRSTGKRFRAQVAHVWTIAAGKAIKFQQYTDTFQFAETAK
jgi:ketosteroid isomerase-like protein